MTEIDRRMIAPGFVEEALESLRRLGKPTTPLLAGVGLSPTVERPISAERYGALWLAIAAELDDEFFGMGARPMRSGSFTLLCHCVLHAPTLGHALRRALRFLDLVLDDPRGELVVGDGLAQIELRDAGAPVPHLPIGPTGSSSTASHAGSSAGASPFDWSTFDASNRSRARIIGFSSARPCAFPSPQVVSALIVPC